MNQNLETLGYVRTVLSGKAEPFINNTFSAIGKTPVKHKVYVNQLGILDDEQADRRYHGGREKALHIYPHEHYDYWQQKLPNKSVLAAPGAFGENISSIGVTEQNICIGDIINIGSTTLQVSQGRMPCWKLNSRFEHPAMSMWVQDCIKTGWYFRVLQKGHIESGDKIVLIERTFPCWSLYRIMKTVFSGCLNPETLGELLNLPLVPSWRKVVEQRIETKIVENWDKRLHYN